MLFELPNFITDGLPTEEGAGACRQYPPGSTSLFETHGSFWLCFVGPDRRVWGSGDDLCKANNDALERCLNATGHTMIRAEVRIAPDGAYWTCGAQGLEDVCGTRVCEDYPPELHAAIVDQSRDAT